MLFFPMASQITTCRRTENVSLMVTSADGNGSLILVQNWLDELQRLVPHQLTLASSTEAA